MYPQNRAVNLYENDFFGTKIKAETILSVIENRESGILDDGMIALYGEWGSGKSTVLKSVYERTQIYNELYFEAWKYENDENLSLSLIHMIVDKLENEKNIIYSSIDKVKDMSRIFSRFAFNLAMNSSINMPGINVNVGDAGKETISEFNLDYSYYRESKEFSKEFSNVIKEYSDQGGKPLLIVIDDLDRCEPNNVLSLISSIKHLLLNPNILYICAIDKNAVQNSIRIKYGNYINHNEYLDKIFGFSLNMSRNVDLNGIVDDFQLKLSNGVVSDSTKDLIVDFFNSIKMNNPRKVKKILSKFSYLHSLDREVRIFSTYEMQLNPIYFDGFNIIMWLFVITIFEFHQEYFFEIADYKYKLENFKHIMQIANKDLNVATNTFMEKGNYLNYIMKIIEDSKFSTDSVTGIIECPENESWPQEFIAFILYLMPSDIKSVNYPSFEIQEVREESLRKLIQNAYFSKNTIAYDFMNFCMDYCLTKIKSDDEIVFYKYFEFASMYF